MNNYTVTNEERNINILTVTINYDQKIHNTAQLNAVVHY